jgi:hypothetical protein
MTFNIHEFQNKRNNPKKYIMSAISTFNDINGKVIVEIGSMRQNLSHKLEEDNHPCCNDGHSSAWFARTGNDFYTIDIDIAATNITRNVLNNLSLTENVTILNGDGIHFLQTFNEVYNKKIDLLFLDAWDVGLENSAEAHLEAYKVAKESLAEKHIILIDDTDVDKINGKWTYLKGAEAGKGKLLIPYLLENGYTMVFNGRQTMFVNYNV